MTVQAATYPLRLPVSVKEAVVKEAKQDGISMNQFIVLAVAEKLALMEATHFFTERKKRADRERFRQILNREGGEPPRDGDEIPESLLNSSFLKDAKSLASPQL